MKKNLLFLCTGDSCRSQMAEGIANKLLPEDITIKSAGTEAQGVNPNAIKVMSDLSIPISHHKSERIDFKDLDNFDIIITLCGDSIPYSSHESYKVPNKFISSELPKNQRSAYAP